MKTQYMFDTNHCLVCVNNKNSFVYTRFEKELQHGGDIYISSIVLSELSIGIVRSKKEGYDCTRIETFITRLDVLPYTSDIATLARDITYKLSNYSDRDGHKKNLQIGHFDTLIAAHAIVQGCTLVTDNWREFTRVKVFYPELKLDNWIHRMV